MDLKKIVGEAMESSPIIDESWKRLVRAFILADELFTGHHVLAKATFWSGASSREVDKYARGLSKKFHANGVYEHSGIRARIVEMEAMARMFRKPLALRAETGEALRQLIDCLKKPTPECVLVVLDAFEVVGFPPEALASLISSTEFDGPKQNVRRVMAALEAVHRTSLGSGELPPDLRFDSTCFEQPRSSARPQCFIRAKNDLELKPSAGPGSLYEVLYVDQNTDSYGGLTYGSHVQVHFRDGGYMSFDCGDEEAAILILSHWGFVDEKGREPDEYSFLAHVKGGRPEPVRSEPHEVSEPVRVPDSVITHLRDNYGRRFTHIVIEAPSPGRWACKGDIAIHTSANTRRGRFEVAAYLYTSLDGDQDTVMQIRGQAIVVDTTENQMWSFEHPTGIGRVEVMVRPESWREEAEAVIRERGINYNDTGSTKLSARFEWDTGE